MYVQHPYKFDGKYYANIDGEWIEISKEVAKVMLADYRNEINRSRRWAPDENCPKKPTQILDCVFSAKVEGISVADLPDPMYLDLEEMMIQREEHAVLHEKLQRLNPQERFIIQSIFFDGMKQMEVAEILGISRGRLSQKLKEILGKMRCMYEIEKFFEK